MNQVQAYAYVTDTGQPVTVTIDVDAIRDALFPEEKDALDRATEALEQIATYVPEKKPREFQFLVLKNIARRALRAIKAAA